MCIGFHRAGFDGIVDVVTSFLSASSALESGATLYSLPLLFLKCGAILYGGEYVFFTYYGR